ncbi:MAG: STAS domain-containing protein [Chloroflexi bacterium]|nr:STAS domain-containing protein [Chloroflexota bacterium]
MPNNTLSTSVRQANSTAIIDLRGEINSFAEEVLNNAYTEANQAHPKIILLNFSGVDYINSTGIALIVGLLAQARKSGQRLFTTGLSSHYVEIFQITRLSDFMNIYPDEASALAAQ